MSTIIGNSIRCSNTGWRHKTDALLNLHGTGPVAFTELGLNFRNAETQRLVNNKMHDFRIILRGTDGILYDGEHPGTTH
jgi:hypothetical protein